MRLSKDEIETFTYKEFVEVYMNKIMELKKVHYVNVLSGIIIDTPKVFFDNVESKRILGPKFRTQIRETYGDLWVSNVGNIDSKLLYDELEKVLKKNDVKDSKIEEIIFYIFIEIIQSNSKYCQNLKMSYYKINNRLDLLFEVTPIPTEYRDLSIYLKEYSGKDYIQEEPSKLDELFTAAETIITDEIGLNIINSIKEIVYKK